MTPTQATTDPELAPKNCPGCGRLAYFRYASKADLRKRRPLCFDTKTCPWRDNEPGRIPTLHREEVHVPCGTCKGTGHVPVKRLTEALAATDPKEWRTTNDLAKALGTSPTHTANLLRELIELGHVERRGTGTRSPYEWRRRAR